VRNPDGGVSQWKPGSNFSFSLGPAAGSAISGGGGGGGARQGMPGGVAVRDAWDGSVRDVRLEVTENGVARALTEAEKEQNAFRLSVGAWLRTKVQSVLV